MKLRHILIPFCLANITANQLYNAARVSCHPKTRKILPDILGELEKLKPYIINVLYFLINNTYCPNLRACHYQVKKTKNLEKFKYTKEPNNNIALFLKENSLF